MPLSSELIQGFSGSCLVQKYDRATAIPEVHKEWWSICTSDHPLVALAAPRGHGKSTAITFAYTLAALLFRDRKFVLVVSDTETQASMFLGDIKRELIDNEDIINLFQIKKFIKDSETDIIVQFEDGEEFRIIARGAEQRVRGLKWRSSRPDLIVCDDLESDEAVLNKDRRERFRKWFNGALLPCRAKHGIVRVVGTVMHLDSLLNRLMPEDSARTTKTEALKSYSILPKPTWKAVRYKAHNEDFTKLLWPEMYTGEFFQLKKEDFTFQGIPEVYAQEYLNYPIDESTAFFKRDDFKEITSYTLRDIEEGTKNYNYYVGCDLAVSTKDRSDYSAFVIAAVDSSGILNIVDVRRGRWDSLEIIDEFFAIARQYSPEWFAIERGTIESSLGPILNAEMIARNTYFKMEKSTANKDKQTRARGIQARIRAGGVKFNKAASWYLDLEEEMVRFPKARHDDQVDAISWLGLTFDQVQHALSEEEEEEMEYEMFLKEQDLGRSLICGY